MADTRMSAIGTNLYTPFERRVRAMNSRYDLPVNDYPTTSVGEKVSERLAKLKRTLQAELNEIEDLTNKAIAFETGNTYQEPEGGKTRMIDELEVLTDLADLMVDMMVYETSELVKFGIPFQAIADIVMDSNDSKLGADGLPIKNEDGKFMKGPNYWKPEPQIRITLDSMIEAAWVFGQKK